MGKMPGKNNGLKDLGDLSDVPMNWQKEVIGILQDIQALWNTGNAGGVSELRAWIDSMQRLSGFSRQLCLQLCMAMSRCLAVDRGANRPSRVELQQAFVRMGGSRHVINMMMMRLSDEVVVGYVVRLLTASTQNSPVASEAFQRDGLNNLKLVLRSIERHRSCWEVAEAGCLLVGNLCACTASKEGEDADLVPARTAAHRTCQGVMASEGAMEMVVELLETYLAEVKALANKAQALMQVKMKEAETVDLKSEEVLVGKTPKGAAKSGGSLKDRMAKVQANVELRAAWQKVIDTELPSGKVQDAALQALTLMTVGNLDTTRQLAGSLYVQHINAIVDLGADFMDKAKASAEEKKNRGKKKRSGAESDSDSEDAAGKPSRQRRKDKRPIELPTGEARRSMTSLESLSHKLHLIVDVLRGRASRDRPHLSIKACRLALILLEHHKSLLIRVRDQGDNQCRAVAIKLMGGPIPEDNREVQQPFATMHSITAALILTLKGHSENAMVITAVMSTLAELRAIALLSVPAGMKIGGSAAEKAWQALLIQAGGPDTDSENLMRQAAKLLVKRAQQTAQGDYRMKTWGMTPNQLEGYGEWLTPRCRKDAAGAQTIAESLASDALRGTWAAGGEPGRWNRIEQRRRQLESEQKLRDDKKAAKEAGMGLEEYRAKMAEKVVPEVEEASSTSSQSGERRVDEADLDAPDWEEEDMMGETNWVRAVGFGEHDQEDFDRMWRKPITDALLFNMPEKADPNSQWAEKAAAARRKLQEEAEALGVPLEDSLDELLVVEMVESVQGKLRVRALVRPQDKIQQNVIEMRAADITKPLQTSKSVTGELSKSLKKNGYLLPKYGLHVKMTRRSASLAQLRGES